MHRPALRSRPTHLAIATLALSVMAGASAVAATSGSAHPSLAPAIDPAGSPHADRPAKEHVPLSVRHVVVEKRGVDGASDRHVLGAKRRRHLVRRFDRLPVWPPNRVQCEIATTTEQVVTFRGRHHTWIATVDAPCRGMTVSRDGDGLPMLVPTAGWDRAVGRILAE
ncbi:MAG TPA: hypothetical protein VG708_11110 [Mycobacteriales bacterium]|jgi:hypothetical protein|nr:hypothetical protein [Mycobacteriales bacterium]